MMMDIESLVRALQASIAPVVLISGIGLLLLSMTNRFGRATDRVRGLCERFKNQNQANKIVLENQITVIYKRCQLLRFSMGLAILSIFLISVIILMLFSFFTLSLSVIIYIPSLFTLSMASLIVSLILFMWDVTLSLHSLRLEIEQSYQE